MNHYAIYCEDTPHSLEKRKVVRPAHVARLEKLAAENRLLLAGPLLEEENKPNGSLIIATFSTLQEAKEWIAADPYVTANVYANVRVSLFQPVLPA